MSSLSSATTSERAFVSVIVPVFNHEIALLRCLDALRRQTYPAHRFEVVIVDNGSTPPLSQVIVHMPRIWSIRETKAGSYAARNRGIEAARGEVLAFTDADCVPAEDWIEKGVAAVQRLSGPGMVGGRIEVFMRDPGRPTTAELVESVLAFPQEAYVEAGFAATANIFTTRATFDRTGLFDETLMSGGDVEWGDRVRSSNLAQTYAEEVRVSHDARRTLRELCRKSRRVAGGVQRIAQQRGRGTSGILTHARQQLIALRRIRANVNHRQLGTLRRKLQFAAAVWVVELLHSFERCRVHLGGTAWRT